MAAWFTIMSRASSEKLKVIISAMGRMPVKAAPTAMPAMASSAMGVSRTRHSPNSASRPWVILYAPWYAPTSSPRRNTLWSRVSSSLRAAFSASRMVRTAISASPSRRDPARRG